MLYRAARAAAAEETQSLTPSVIASTPGASASYTLYTTLPPPLPPPPAPTPTRVRVLQGDTFTVARTLQRSASPSARIAVLNLASERNPGGGWLRGSLAQEEALCLRSTLGATLRRPDYPLKVLGGVWSPGVVVFRDEIVRDCAMLEEGERFVVGVVSVAGLRHPELTEDGLDYKSEQDAQTMQDKLRLTLRIMANNGITHCVLGALGCGVFGNPARKVAQLFYEVILEEEFRGHFAEVSFGILDPKKEGNGAVFEEVFGDFVIEAQK